MRTKKRKRQYDSHERGDYDDADKSDYTGDDDEACNIGTEMGNYEDNIFSRCVRDGNKGAFMPTLAMMTYIMDHTIRGNNTYGHIT